MRKVTSILFVLAVIGSGCKTKTERELILGSWEITPTGKMAEEIDEARSLGLPVYKIVLTFNADSTMKSETVSDSKDTETHTGSYSIEDNGKNLIIYREGKRDRKNVAAIHDLDESRMMLIDVSGSGDTMQLKKINN